MQPTVDQPPPHLYLRPTNMPTAALGPGLTGRVSTLSSGAGPRITTHRVPRERSEIRREYVHAPPLLQRTGSGHTLLCKTLALDPRLGFAQVCRHAHALVERSFRGAERARPFYRLWLFPRHALHRVKRVAARPLWLARPLQHAPLTPRASRMASRMASRSRALFRTSTAAGRRRVARLQCLILRAVRLRPPERVADRSQRHHAKDGRAHEVSRERPR